MSTSSDHPTTPPQRGIKSYVLRAGRMGSGQVRALVESGTRIVSYITFGRAPEPGDRTDLDIDFDQD